MMKLEYPVVPIGSVPNCFNCKEVKADPNSVCHTGYSEGNGSQSAVCRTCGMTTYFDYAPEIPVAKQAHVVMFSDGTYLGQARTRVENAMSAVLYTPYEAREKCRVYEPGTYMIVPFAWGTGVSDADREKAMRQMERGR